MIQIMISTVQFIAHHFLIVAIVLYLLVQTAILIVRAPVSAKKAANWPETEATIRAVRKVVVGPGRYVNLVDVGDFTYIVNDDYYSGRVEISRCFSTHGAEIKNLVNQKFWVRYNPKKLEQYSVPQQEVANFLLDPFDEAFADA